MPTETKTPPLRAIPPAPRAQKPKAAKSKASKSKAPKLASAPPKKPAAKRDEVDPTKLAPEDAKKRVAAIYKLEKEVEAARAKYEAARATSKSYKRDLASAEEALKQEIEEQRFGPGPLFDPTGQGPAATAKGS